LECERLQEASVNGESVDADALIRVNSELRRVFGMLRKKGETKTGANWMDDLEARYADADDDKAEAGDA
jgi:hypothetical protein